MFISAADLNAKIVEGIVPPVAVPAGPGSPELVADLWAADRASLSACYPTVIGIVDLWQFQARGLEASGAPR